MNLRTVRSAGVRLRARRPSPAATTTTRATTPKARGPAYFGFVRDHRGSPVSDAQVVLRPKSGEPVAIKTNVLGLYRSHINKDVAPDDVRSPARRTATSRPGVPPHAAGRQGHVHRDRLHVAAVVGVVLQLVSRAQRARMSRCRPGTRLLAISSVPGSARDRFALRCAASGTRRSLLLGCACICRRTPKPPTPSSLNGKIVTYDAAPAQALAVRDGKIAAIGSTADIRALAAPSTRVIDLGGRTVIPGLIDSHIHAIRAGLTCTTEVHWIGVRTLAEALDRLRAAAKTAPKGAWLVVAGGWTERQFKEDRRPTQAEIAAAAPDHHVYVQELYSRVLLDPGGSAALGIASLRLPRGSPSSATRTAHRPAGSPATTAPSAICSTFCRGRTSRRRSPAPRRSSARSTPWG